MHKVPGGSGVLTIGVDPGGRSTGVIAREGNALHWAAILVRDGAELLPGPDYFDEVFDGVNDALNSTVLVGGYRLAVEGLVHPNGHVGIANVTGLLGTAMVLGAILSRFPDALVVPPGKHGAAPLTAYPEALRGPREKRGAGRARHARSAWDIAGAAVQLAALEHGR